jgi:chitin disaccharide deacetylase
MPSPRMNSKIIINADDFGLSAESNQAIVEAFKSGSISSTTLMANMPGFEAACELAHQHQLHGKIGVHLNLTAGLPLSDPIKGCRRFCDEFSRFRRRQTCFRLSKQERCAIETEFAAQVQACLNHGISPTHLDSHNHVHTEWPIGAAAIKVAQLYGIGAIRLSRNCGPGIGVVHKLYKLAYNSRLRYFGLAKTRYFGSAADVQQILATTRGSVEIMVHLTSEDPHCTPDDSADLGFYRGLANRQFASYAG